MTFLLCVAFAMLGVLIFIIGFGAYSWFDNDLREPIVERCSDAVRIQKRYEPHGDCYWIQGRVFGIWMDYTYKYIETGAKEEAQRLLDMRKRMKNKSEVVEEYKI